MSSEVPVILKKGIEIAKLLNGAGLVMKECTVVNKKKRIFYTRGDKLLETIEKNADKILRIYDEGEQKENISPTTIAQKLLRDNLIARLDRVHEEKKYYWPRKLFLTNVRAECERVEFGV